VRLEIFVVRNADDLLHIGVHKYVSNLNIKHIQNEKNGDIKVVVNDVSHRAIILMTSYITAFAMAF
jgi:hypothetical protein